MNEYPELIWVLPITIQWYALCAVPARWYGWNGRYSLPLGMINDFFMADGSKARPLAEWFENKEFSTEAANGTIANTFHMFVNREPSPTSVYPMRTPMRETRIKMRTVMA